MGYYTDFSIKYYGPDKDVKVMEEAAANLEIDPSTESFMKGIQQLIAEGYIQAKWYTFQKDFVDWASKFPTILFIVEGSGEDIDDLWELRVKGTKNEYRAMAYPPLKNKTLLTDHEKIAAIMNESNNK